MKFVLCSDCFSNQGLRDEATKLGVHINKTCPNCGSATGAKLRQKSLEKLTHRFFIQGTIPHGVGGYASILQYNSEPNDEVDFDEQTNHDWLLIKSKIGGRLFYNAPALWRVGITDHYDEPYVVTDETIAEIVTQLSIKTIPKGTKTFRIRKNLEGNTALDASQFGIPPTDLRRDFGRFDEATLPLLYTSPSLPVCLHECRVAITDEIFVATFEAKKDLRLANLTTDYNQQPSSPFEDLKYFFNGISLARDQGVYKIARRIATAIKNSHSVDGFIADSFFTTIAQEPVSQNLCFFADAVADKNLELHSINRLHLKTVTYDFIFGPNFATTE
jgi:hypothetical protein